ncbi:hypothetical protein BCR44DRAFT_335372 [Catenaria anguillulae PL171]|uniref:LysM domain-containing protein n=1 Tax=Catenaria anguillulae PL171 TaxID=765915 RepID=A0A1Y2HHX1_9FUNG|nr:hypothetical protein BCR44DRAFT_335372 [Catenaria anguillulae PL171]
MDSLAVSTSTLSSTRPSLPCLLHPVSSADTLSGIALKYGAHVSALRRLNRLYSDDAIFARPFLVIPLNPSMTCQCHGQVQPFRPEDSEHQQIDSAIEVDLTLAHSHRWSVARSAFPSPPPTPEPTSLSCSPTRQPRRGPSCPPPKTRREASLTSMATNDLALLMAPHRCPTCNAFAPTFLLANYAVPTSLQSSIPLPEAPISQVSARFDDRITQIDDEIASALSAWNQVTSVEPPFVAPLEDPSQPFRPLTQQDSRSQHHRHHLLSAHAAVHWVLSLLDVPNKASVVPIGKASRVRIPSSSVASTKGSEHEEDREYELHYMRRRHVRDSVTSVET